MIFKIKNMKLYTLLIVGMCAFASCKKDKQDNISYSVSVKVPDNVGYKLEIKDRQPLIRDVRPGVTNTSTTETVSYELNTGAFATVTTVPYYKDELLEITITKTLTGEVIKKETGKENITVIWVVK